MDTREWLNEEGDLKPSIGLPLAIGIGAVGLILVGWLIWLMFTDILLFFGILIGGFCGLIGLGCVFCAVCFIYMKIEDFARANGGSNKRNFGD